MAQPANKSPAASAKQASEKEQSAQTKGKILSPARIKQIQAAIANECGHGAEITLDPVNRGEKAPRAGITWSEAEIGILLSMKREGWGIREIAGALKRSTTAIRENLYMLKLDEITPMNSGTVGDVDG